MPQLNFGDPSAVAGSLSRCGGPEPDIIHYHNPLRSQTGVIDIDSTTTDGTYTLNATGADGTSFDAEYVAASKTAAQIAAGLAAAINDGIVSRGLAFATVINTDQFKIEHNNPGVEYTYTLGGPSGPDVLANSIEAGYTEVAAGIILQSDAAGGFTTSYSDAALGLGVTIRNTPSLQRPFDVYITGDEGYPGPSEISLVASGYVDVDVKSGITVLRGEKVYFNSTTKTWSNVTTDSHVLVEGAQWQTSGTGVQTVRVRFPSET